MLVRFYGVRGSCPCPSPANTRYGANTSAVYVDADPEFPILLDMGSGLLRLADDEALGEPAWATALLTHLHLDHVLGLPFFPPAHAEGAHLDVYGPAQESGSFEEAMTALVGPPYFPVPLERFRANMTFHGVTHADFDLGRATVRVRPVPHVGPTVGFRIECEGASVAYVSDHQAPPGLETVAGDVLDLCDGVDLLIHDAQYTDAEFALKSHWGHCTINYAVRVATQSHAKRLCLFHHDPARTDDELDRLLEEARALAAGAVDDVIAASEGLAVTV